MKKLFLAVFTSFVLNHVGLLASFAPDSLKGYKLDESDTYYIFTTESLMDEHDVEEDEVRPGLTYTYEKTGDNTGIMTKPYPDGSVDTYSLQFNSISTGVITDDSNRPFTLETIHLSVPDPVTVVSDPNGQAVVVQVDEEYKWSSTLDGVTLWGVEQSSDGWSSMTMRFENGRNFGNQGFFDSVAQPQPYDVSYEIDENGYIKSLEDDGDYQYYNPVSVENGVIGTIQNDEGVESVADNGFHQVDQWFFTSRAAAEEFYYSKVNPKDWMWFDQYPWVYSSEEQGWLYFYPLGGKLLYWSVKGQAWRQFN